MPSALGTKTGWDLNVWASNLQGPKRIDKERHQYEFKADGEDEICYKQYPLIYAVREVGDPNDLPYNVWLKIMEDDEFIDPDDFIGYAYIDCHPCKEQIFDKGKKTGWTNTLHYPGTHDVSYVEYQLYCEKIDLPSAPVQISPSYNSTVSSLNPILAWDEIDVHPQVQDYWVEVYNITKSKLVYSYKRLNYTHVTLPTLEYDCKYRWKVSARNNEGWGSFSSDWTFWTPSNQALPGPPNLIYPSHNSTISVLCPTFRWSAVQANPPVDIYRLMIRKVQGDVIVFNENVGNVTSYNIPAGVLQNNTQYKWQIRPHNSLGWGAWSGFWWFTISQ